MKEANSVRKHRKFKESMHALMYSIMHDLDSAEIICTEAKENGTQDCTQCEFKNRIHRFGCPVEILQGMIVRRKE